MKELIIYQGHDYTWGWDKQTPPQLQLQITAAGSARMKDVFGEARQVTMTVESGEPERITVKMP